MAAGYNGGDPSSSPHPPENKIQMVNGAGPVICAHVMEDKRLNVKKRASEYQ